MAVYHDARCRLCRREGIKLFLKGDRCFSDKCAIERRGYAPGEHGKSRRAKETNYGLQLREKQKARGTPDWLELEADLYKGRVLQTPSRESIQIPVNEQLIVELYSK